ncbi:hypothetical protein Pfo_018772 [Paulownia fortunei]|nr:hypothetical protein Pfo_018772 [Paulownia fortunei]
MKMSAEELKIREELEREVENDLEGEIKDGIYHLALRLHKLYQHQKERTLKQSSDQQNEHGHARKKMLSEVNINIKLEGGTTIQIKEIKKGARGSSRLIPIPSPKQAQNVQGKIARPSPRSTKFDWTRSLRSGGSNAFNVNTRTQDKNRDKVKRK